MLISAKIPTTTCGAVVNGGQGVGGGNGASNLRATKGEDGFGLTL